MEQRTITKKEKILARNKKIVAENLAILKDWVASEPKVSLVMPNYVSTSFIKLDIKDDDTQFCIDLLEETGVYSYPVERLIYLNMHDQAIAVKKKFQKKA